MHIAVTHTGNPKLIAAAKNPAPASNVFVIQNSNAKTIGFITTITISQIEITNAMKAQPPLRSNMTGATNASKAISIVVIVIV